MVNNSPQEDKDTTEYFSEGADRNIAITVKP